MWVCSGKAQPFTEFFAVCAHWPALERAVPPGPAKAPRGQGSRIELSLIRTAHVTRHLRCAHSKDHSCPRGLSWHLSPAQKVRHRPEEPVSPVTIPEVRTTGPCRAPAPHWSLTLRGAQSTWLPRGFLFLELQAAGSLPSRCLFLHKRCSLQRCIEVPPE